MATALAGRLAVRRRIGSSSAAGIGCRAVSSSRAGSAAEVAEALDGAGPVAEVPETPRVGDLAPEVPVADEIDLGEWIAIYINLDRRPDRRRQLYRVLGRANPVLLERLERLAAVDGRQLKLDDEALLSLVEEEALLKAQRAVDVGASTIIYSGSSLVHFDDHFTPGGIACAMSHRLALERIASHPTAQWGLILEDDVRATLPRVEEALRKVLRHVPEDWDAVFLGYHDGQARLHPSAWGEGDEEEVPAEARKADVLVEQMHSGLYGLYAWMVTRQAAQAMLESAFPIHGQVDHALSTWLVRERGRAYKVAPKSMIFYSPTSEEEGDSDIQTMTPLNEVMKGSESVHDFVFEQWLALNTGAPLLGHDVSTESPYLGGEPEWHSEEDWPRPGYDPYLAEDPYASRSWEYDYNPLRLYAPAACDLSPPDCFEEDDDMDGMEHFYDHTFAPPDDAAELGAWEGEGHEEVADAAPDHTEEEGEVDEWGDCLEHSEAWDEPPPREESSWMREAAERSALLAALDVPRARYPKRFLEIDGSEEEGREGGEDEDRGDAADEVAAPADGAAPAEELAANAGLGALAGDPVHSPHGAELDGPVPTPTGR